MKGSWCGHCDPLSPNIRCHSLLQGTQISNSTDVNFSRILDGFSFSFPLLNPLQTASFRETSLSEDTCKVLVLV